MQGNDIQYMEIDGRPAVSHKGRYITYDQVRKLQEVEAHRSSVNEARAKKKAKRKMSGASRKKNRK